MNDLRTSDRICAETEPALGAELTRVRGVVRRLPDGPAKDRASVLAGVLESPSPDRLKTHLGVMSGAAPIPIEDSALWAHAPGKAAAYRERMGE